ncbi:MAG: GDP-mannose dehydrogenase, partial [Bacteroidia bacterium]|nr:GDP-mannose dehydrogenase [Bacteroidia bacterium]
SKARFFRNQEKLKEIHIEQDLNKALVNAEAVIFAVPHKAYQNLDPEKVVKLIGHPAAIIDCFGILTDDNIRRYFQLGCEVKGLGRGHIQRIKDEIRKG